MTRKVGAAVLSALLLSTILVVGPSDTALAAKPQAPLTKDNIRTDLPRVLDGEVLAVHEAGGRAYVGGNFTTVEIEGIEQNIPHFFALDLNSGDLLDGRGIGDYPLDSIKREKDDAKEVREGFECGIKLSGYNDVKEGDILEAYKIEEVARTL